MRYQKQNLKKLYMLNIKNKTNMYVKEKNNYKKHVNLRGRS